jgi:hypothetical protein
VSGRISLSRLPLSGPMDQFVAPGVPECLSRSSSASLHALGAGTCKQGRSIVDIATDPVGFVVDE